jgi:autotransporter-associated beta strand protein
LFLNAANTYTGATTISNGVVQLGNATGLGATNGGTTVVSGATLDLNGQAVGAELSRLPAPEWAETARSSTAVPALRACPVQ